MRVGDPGTLLDDRLERVLFQGVLADRQVPGGGGPGGLLLGTGEHLHELPGRGPLLVVGIGEQDDVGAGELVRGGGGAGGDTAHAHLELVAHRFLVEGERGDARDVERPLLRSQRLLAGVPGTDREGSGLLEVHEVLEGLDRGIGVELRGTLLVEDALAEGLGEDLEQRGATGRSLGAAGIDRQGDHPVLRDVLRDLGELLPGLRGLGHQIVVAVHDHDRLVERPHPDRAVGQDHVALDSLGEVLVVVARGRVLVQGHDHLAGGVLIGPVPVGLRDGGGAARTHLGLGLGLQGRVVRLGLELDGDVRVLGREGIDDGLQCLLLGAGGHGVHEGDGGLGLGVEAGHPAARGPGIGVAGGLGTLAARSQGQGAGAGEGGEEDGASGGGHDGPFEDGWRGGFRRTGVRTPAAARWTARG
jgi:hypothetical protein